MSPKNSAKVVVCTAKDFWFSFDALSEIRLDLESFNYALKGLFDEYKLALDDNTYESFINSLKTLDKLISTQGIADTIKKTTSTSKRLLEALADNAY